MKLYSIIVQDEEMGIKQTYIEQNFLVLSEHLYFYRGYKSVKTPIIITLISQRAYFINKLNIYSTLFAGNACIVLYLLLLIDNIIFPAPAFTSVVLQVVYALCSNDCSNVCSLSKYLMDSGNIAVYHYLYI